MNASLTWVEGMKFSSDNHGLISTIDAAPEHGGTDQGPTPKELVLNAMMGCTAMDVISILMKMRVEVDKFNVTVEGFLTEEHPKQFYKMNVVYEFTGKNLPMDKLKKAVELSEERYCGVTAVYKRALEVTSEIKVIEPE